MVVCTHTARKLVCDSHSLASYKQIKHTKTQIKAAIYHMNKLKEMKYVHLHC